MGGGGVWNPTTHPTVFCLVLNFRRPILKDNTVILYYLCPYLKHLNFSQLFVADAHMKFSSHPPTALLRHPILKKNRIFFFL